MSIAELLPAASQRFVSIDFGQAYLKIVYGKRRERGVEIIIYDMRRLMFGGEKKGEAIDFITQFIAKNAVDEKEVFVTISDADSITIKHLVLPQLPQDALADAIHAQFKNESLFLRENSLLDWQVVRGFLDESGTRKQELVCVFAKNAVLDRYLSILKECGLKPLRISSSPFNYAHILRQTSYGGGVVTVFDMGFRDATLSIFKQHKLVFIRNLAFSSDKLTQSLTASMPSGNETVEFSYEKAEEIKKEFGVPVDEARQLTPTVQGGQVLSLMRPFLEGLTRELKVSMDYFTERFKEDHSQVLYMTGGGANVKNLAYYLSTQLQLDVCLLSLPQSVNAQRLDKERFGRDQCQLMSAIGCALTDAESIDLTPINLKIEKIEQVEEISLKFSVLVLAVIFFALLGLVKLQAYQYRVRLDNMRMHVQALAEVGRMKEKIDARIGLIHTVRKGKVPADGLLTVFGALTPHGIILEEVTLDQLQHRTTIRGTVNSADAAGKRALEDLIRNLKGSEYFQEVSLMFSRVGDHGQEFQLQCVLAS